MHERFILSLQKLVRFSAVSICLVLISCNQSDKEPANKIDKEPAVSTVDLVSQIEGLIIDLREDPSLLIAPPKQTKTQIESTEEGVALSGWIGTPNPGGSTNGAYIELVNDELYSGRLVKVQFIAKAIEANSELSVAYSTNDVGNSGWKTFSLTEDFQLLSFLAPVSHASLMPSLPNGAVSPR